MTTAVAKAEPNGFSEEQVGLLKRTICKGATDDEFLLFVSQCKRTGLDPFSRQIHAVKRWDSQSQREVMTIQTGIDGYRLIADRTGLYAGNDEPKYDTEDADHPNKATVTVWKIVAGQRVPFTRSARWEEFKQTKKDGTLTRFWKTMPYLMLGKVAEALALRAAFPQELSGIYTNEEMEQADSGEAAPRTAPAPVEQPIDKVPPASVLASREQRDHLAVEMRRVGKFHREGWEWCLAQLRTKFPGECERTRKSDELTADQCDWLAGELMTLPTAFHEPEPVGAS
jgi:phage recombination protein Bet